MSWLKNVVERRGSKEELEWIKLMGVDCVNEEEVKGQICTEEVERLKCLTLTVEPEWYQELSDRQLYALQGLCYAVRDDFDLKEIIRVISVLQYIGLHPMPPFHLIQRALILSSGHELAFLWFLLDIWYLTFTNSKPEQGFCLNERLLLMSITHLDMAPTLRGLDKLMPVPVKPLKCTCPVKKPEKEKYWSPYLEPNPKPTLPKSEKCPPLPDRRFNIHPYDDWKDYFPENERNRWFSKGSDHPKIQFPQNHLPQKSHTENVVDDILKKTLEDLENYESTAECLCLKHRQEKLHQEKQDRIQQLSEFNRSDFKSDLAQETLKQIEDDVTQARMELNRVSKEFEAGLIIRGLVQDLLTKAAAARFVQPCEDCSYCRSEYVLYKDILDKKIRSEEGPTDEGTAPDYFRAPSTFQPYEFRYDLIFSNETSEEIEPIKAAINAALGSEASQIEKIFTEMWQQELRKWHERQQEIVVEKEEKQEKDTQEKETLTNSSESIRKFLKKYFSSLAKDPYYILPSLPNAYKLPIFEAWTRNRYNLKVSQRKRNQILLTNQYQWNVLKRAWPRFNPPRNRDICPCGFDITFDSFNHLSRLNKLMRAEYERCLKQNLVNINRLYWKSFEPTLCSPRLREAFYAYNPGAEKEVHPKRPWYSYEKSNFLPVYEL